MPRDTLPPSVLQRHLQVIFSHTTNNLDVGISPYHHKSRKRAFSELERERESESEQDIDKFKGRLLGVEDGLIAAVLPKPQEMRVPQVHIDRDKEVDKFKGRLLGVEDGLIDAIVSESYPSEPDRQRHLGSSSTFPWYSQAEARAPEIYLLQSRKGTIENLARPAKRGRNASAGSGSPFPHSSHLDSGFSNMRCSNVDDDDATNHSPFTNAVGSRCDSIASDDSVCNGTYSNRSWSPIETQHATTKHSILPMPNAHDSSLSTCESNTPEARDEPTELDGIVVDSMMLERSDDGPSLGTWDLSNWRTLGFTMSDLLLQRESRDGRC